MATQMSCPTKRKGISDVSHGRSQQTFKRRSSNQCTMPELSGSLSPFSALVSLSDAMSHPADFLASLVVAGKAAEAPTVPKRRKVFQDKEHTAASDGPAKPFALAKDSVVPITREGFCLGSGLVVNKTLVVLPRHFIVDPSRRPAGQSRRPVWTRGSCAHRHGMT